MKNKGTILLFLVLGTYAALGQDVPGLRFCLLFDSSLEKNAFQNDKQSDCDPLVFFLAPDPSVDSVSYKHISRLAMKSAPTAILLLLKKTSLRVKSIFCGMSLTMPTENT